MEKIRILTSIPRYVSTYGNGFVAHSIAMGMNSENVISDMFSVYSEVDKDNPHVKQAFPSRLIYRLFNKLFGGEWIDWFAEKKLRKIVKDYDIVYLWPGYSLETLSYVKQLGKILVQENINCHQMTSKAILDAEQNALGLKDMHYVSEQKVLDEKKKLDIGDFVFSPSLEVTHSLIENGVDTDKIIETSYGLSTEQILPDIKRENQQPVFLFVGSIVMRKGVHLLLKYWQDANINGTLKIVGQIDPLMDELLAPYKQNDSIEFIPFTKDICSLYQQADVFVLSSLEEGSPLVTYLALGAGLPCIVSPMGGGGVIQDGIEGHIIQPYDQNKWVNTLRDIAADKEKRKQMSLAAANRAKHFVWPLVAARRRDSLLKKIGEK